MEYEVVALKEKTVVGISARTGNQDPKMGEVIGKLWDRFFTEGVYENIQNKCNAYGIGLYDAYEGAEYTVTVGAEVSKAGCENLSVKIIPAGRYAKFSVCGNMTAAVAEAWGEIWKMDLDRSYTGDFEEYLNSDMENAKVDIYVALN